MNKPVIITIVGRSGSGKTTLVEKLVRHYKKKGLRVSALKSMRHDFNMDHEGKDSYRYREAGVFSGGITNGRVFAMVRDLEGENPMDLALKYYSDSDLVIIEGFKEGNSDKIEVVGNSEEPPLFIEGITNIKFIISDRDIDAGIPVYKRDDIRGISEEIDCIFF